MCRGQTISITEYQICRGQMQFFIRQRSSSNFTKITLTITHKQIYIQPSHHTHTHIIRHSYLYSYQFILSIENKVFTKHTHSGTISLLQHSYYKPITILSSLILYIHTFESTNNQLN